MNPGHVFILLAVVAETIATAALQMSEQFSRVIPTAVSLLGFAVALYLMSLTLKYIPLGVTYAVWSGLGIVLVSVVGFLLFNQKIDLAGLLGIALILIGILVIHLFSKTAVH